MRTYLVREHVDLRGEREPVPVDLEVMLLKVEQRLANQLVVLGSLQQTKG